MIKSFLSVFLLSAVISAMTVPAQANSGIEDRAAASRATVQEFFGALKGELVAGLKTGGPVNAIGTCNEKAPGIAKQVSTAKGWNVARTSLKLRNPKNAPDAWERAVLIKFDDRRAAGEDPAKMEHFEVVEKDGKKVFRYMKAIPTAPKPCLACHGEKITPEVEAKLSELYPDDVARGYKAGDIRGAFTITQPME